MRLEKKGYYRYRSILPKSGIILLNKKLLESSELISMRKKIYTDETINVMIIPFSENKSLFPLHTQ
jgi:hypothetical protein